MKSCYAFAANFAGSDAVDVVVAGKSGIFLTLGVRTGGGGASFLRGDANADASLNIADPVFLLWWLFLGGREPPCRDAGDADDDGALTIGDPVVILRYLYLGETAPAAPFGSCGFDRTADELGCEAFAPCEGSL